MTDTPHHYKRNRLISRRNQALPEQDTQKNTTQYRILIVDDDPIMLAMLDKVLSQFYDVVRATDGRDAMKKLAEGAFNMVITDAMMPEMSGLELLAAMRSDMSLADTPTIILTAFGNIDTMKKALDLGAVDVVNKPFVPEILLKRVRNLIRMREAARTAEQNKLYEQRFRQQSRMLWMLEHDELTGLLNRQAFYRKISAYLDSTSDAKDKKYLFLRWDIDDFTVINDAMGVEKGDHLLRCIGQMMLHHRRTDILMGHIESDHFAVFLSEDVIQPERLFSIMQTWLTNTMPEYRACFRMGVYRVEDPTVNPATMCDRALFALRSTKGSYTDRVSYYSMVMRDQLMEEQQLAEDMLPGLKNEQFEVYYQPLYNYSSRELIGAEALVRWNHPTRGLLSPGVFLPLFESNGLISQLDSYVWEHVCRQIKIWIQRYGERMVPISVNVSRLDVHSGDLCERLCALTKKYDIPIHCLRLEITESAYMKNSQSLSATVKALADAGFTIEMDDFGSAYSSLNMLKDIPVDILKLDMKFLSLTEDSVRSGNILSSVIRMARWLKLPVIAEGVETKAQADYLKSIGCLYMQGYLFSRPIWVEEFEKILKNSVAGKMNQYDDVDLRPAENFWDASALTALVFNSFVGGTAILEQNGDSLEMLRANDRFFEIRQTTHEEYQSYMLDIWSRFERVSRVTFKQMLDRAAESGEVASCEVVSKSMEGREPIWTRNRAKLLAQNDNSRIYYVSVENITDQKRAEAGLIRQKEQLDRLYNSVPCGIVDYAFSKDSVRMLNFNDTVWKQLGFRSRIELQSSCAEGQSPMLVHPDDVAVTQQKMKEALTSDRYTTVECRLRHRDGSYHWYEVRLQRELSGEGTGTLQSVLADIGDRKEQEIWDYGKFLFTAYFNVALFDFSQNNYRIIVRDSKLHTESTPHANLKDYIEHWISIVVLPEYRQDVRDFCHLEALRTACAGDNAPQLEYQFGRQDGSIVWVRSTLLMIDHNRFLCCMQNITEEKKSEELARQNAVLQATVEQQEHYRAMVEQTGLCAIEWNCRTNQFFHSKGYERYSLSRCDANELRCNRVDRAAFAEEDSARLDQFLDAIGSGAIQVEATLRMKMIDGTCRWTHIRHDFIHDEQGKPYRIIVTLTDVEEETHSTQEPDKG